MSRGMFVIAILAIYIMSFLSQMLLSGQFINRVGPWGFALVQAALTWAWYLAHARRLRDAGRTSGLALGIAIVYALAIVLLLLIVVSTMPASSSISPTAPPAEDEPMLMTYFLLMYLLAMLFGGPMMGLLGCVLIVIGLLLLSPMLIAFAYSIWTATRPPVATP